VRFLPFTLPVPYPQTSQEVASFAWRATPNKRSDTLQDPLRANHADGGGLVILTSPEEDSVEEGDEARMSGQLNICPRSQQRTARTVHDDSKST